MFVQADNQTPEAAPAKVDPKLLLHTFKYQNCSSRLRNACKTALEVK